MKKKMLSLVLAVAIIVSVLSTIAVSAVVSEIIARTTADLTVDQTWANPGDTVDVNVFVAENPGIMGATLTVSWGETLTLVKATSGEVFSDMTYTPPSRYNPMGTSFVWYRNAVGNVMDGVVLTLTFQVPETATIDSIQPICVTYTEGDVFNSNDEDVTLSITDGYVQIIDYMPGDVTGDGRVNTRDLVRLSQYISDGSKTDPEGYNAQVTEEACDVTGDGKINAKDLIRLSQYISDGNRTNPNGYNAVLKPAPSPECKHTNMVATEAKAPTCTEDGNIAYWFCESCAKYFSDAEAKNEILPADTQVDATGHTYASDWSYDEKAHWHIATCEHSYEVADYAEHSFVDHLCSMCGLSETAYQQCVVTFVDFDNSVIDIQPVVYGGDAIKPDDPVRKNYAFIGWDTAFTNVVSDLTVKAQYVRQYTVTFVDYDGTVIATDVVNSGDDATAPVAPDREGYTFTSWSQIYDNVLSDLEVMAVYKINRYTVTFLHADGSVISTVSNVVHGATVTPPQTAEIYFDWSKTKGYRFTGWKKWDETQPIVSDISITADYSEEITEPIIAIETVEISKGTTSAIARVYLCGSLQNVCGMSIPLRYAEQLDLNSNSAIVNSKFVGSEVAINTEDCLYELSWADGQGIDINDRQEVLKLTFNIDKYTAAGEYVIELLDGTNIIDENLHKITPIIVEGHIRITE